MLFYYRKKLQNFCGLRQKLPFLFIALALFLALYVASFGEEAQAYQCEADATSYTDLKAPWNKIVHPPWAPQNTDICDFAGGFEHIPEYKLCCKNLILKPTEIAFIFGGVAINFIMVATIHIIGIGLIMLVK